MNRTAIRLGLLFGTIGLLVGSVAATRLATDRCSSPAIAAVPTRPSSFAQG
jgi:hypothetical protein